MAPSSRAQAGFWSVWILRGIGFRQACSVNQPILNGTIYVGETPSKASSFPQSPVRSLSEAAKRRPSRSRPSYCPALCRMSILPTPSSAFAFPTLLSYAVATLFILPPGSQKEKQGTQTI